MAALGQEDMMYDSKEPVEGGGKGSGAVTIMKFWIMGGMLWAFNRCSYGCS